MFISFLFPMLQEDAALRDDDQLYLYERAHEAAKEAQRQGDAQLQAAVAAVAAYYPVAAPVRFSAWSLKFEDRRLEAVYLRKCKTDWDCNDLGGVSCELVFCLLRLWLTQNHKKPSLICFLHICVAAFCMLLITFQLFFSKWYQPNRGLFLRNFVISLWCWECSQLLLAASKEDVVHLASLVLPQCILISFVNSSPFCSHIRSRVIACACQVLATFGRSDNLTLLLGILLAIGHCFGTALAYALDQRVRFKFVEALPSWVLDDQRGKQSSPQQPSSSKSTVSYPELLEKPEEATAAEAAAKDNQSTAVHRALGGFAGGFGGVSGLKSANITSAASSSSTISLEEEQDHDREMLEVSDPSASEEEDDDDGLQESVSSASSQVNPGLRRRI